MVEKTPATVDDIAARFGSRVASLVAAVSDPPGLDDYRARKTALRDQIARATPDAQAIYAADKLAKARELRALATRLHTSPDRPRAQGAPRALPEQPRDARAGAAPHAPG